MNTNTVAQSYPDQVDYPQATGGSFSAYTLDFDEFAEPRTIPANWDPSGLLSASSRSNHDGSQLAGNRSAPIHPEGLRLE